MVGPKITRLETFIIGSRGGSDYCKGNAEHTTRYFPVLKDFQLTRY